MTDSNEDTDEYVTNAVRDILVERETGERSVVIEKMYEYRVTRHRIERRLRDIESRTSRKPKNYKLSEYRNRHFYDIFSL